MTQEKYSFDPETCKKIIKGVLLAATGGLAIGLLDYIGTVQIDSPILAAMIATIIPAGINAVREFMKGQ